MHSSQSRYTAQEAQQVSLSLFLVHPEKGTEVRRYNAHEAPYLGDNERIMQAFRQAGYATICISRF